MGPEIGTHPPAIAPGTSGAPIGVGTIGGTAGDPPQPAPSTDKPVMVSPRAKDVTLNLKRFIPPPHNIYSSDGLLPLGLIRHGLTLSKIGLSKRDARCVKSDIRGIFPVSDWNDSV